MLSCHVRDEVILRLLQNEIFIFFQRNWSVVFLKYVRNIDFFKLIKFYQRDSGVQQYFFFRYVTTSRLGLICLFIQNQSPEVFYGERCS